MGRGANPAVRFGDPDQSRTRKRWTTMVKPRREWTVARGGEREGGRMMTETELKGERVSAKRRDSGKG
eukprot:753270-Hanusia_phi.AAC.6